MNDTPDRKPNIPMQKKMLVLNAIDLGMEPSRAFILAELTQAEIESINTDGEFQMDMIRAEVLKEHQLLEKFKGAMEIAVLKGSTKPIEFLLSKMQGTKWAQKEKTDVDDLCRLLITDREKNLL